MSNPSPNDHNYLRADTEEFGFELSNTALSDTEESIVYRSIAKEQNSIIAIDNEIAHLETTITRLRERKTKHLARIERLRVGVAPHRKLPAELLARIFVEASTGVAADDPHRTMRWVCAHVCSRWRAVVMNEPRLWEYVYLPDGFRQPEAEMSVSIARDILSGRGGFRAVTLFVHLARGEDWQAMLDLMSTYPLRVRALQLRIGLECSAFLSVPQDHFRLLESVTIFLKESFVPEPRKTLVAAFSTAKKLKNLEVSVMSRDKFRSQRAHLIPIIGSPTVEFPWDSLTNLSIMKSLLIPVAEVAEILRRATNLNQLTIGLCSKRMAPEDAQVVMPKLLRLDIQHRNGRLLEFLSILHPPSLESLVLGVSAHTGDLFAGVVNFTERIGGNIRLFSSLKLPVSAAVICALMRAMPMLETFLVRMWGYTTESMVAAICGERLCQNLRECHGFAVETVDAALRFLRLRWEAVPDGFRDVKIAVKWDSFERNYANFELMRPIMLKSGRRVALVPD